MSDLGFKAFAQPAPPPQEHTEVRGTEAMWYAIERDLIETALKIAIVETASPRNRHSVLPPGTLVLTFYETPEVYVMNQLAISRLLTAFGASGNWRGHYVRITPVEHTDYDDEPFWVLELEPLWLCERCQQEHTPDKETKICEWCKYADRQEERNASRDTARQAQTSTA